MSEADWFWGEQVPFSWQGSFWQRANALLKSQRLPNALLFSGQTGLGKAAFALKWAQRMVCDTPNHHASLKDGSMPCGQCGPCCQVREVSYPGLHWLTAEAPSKVIKIDQVREVIEAIQHTCDGWRIVVIEQAEQMNEAAQNALLKSLEEPSARTLFLLLSSQPARLLPTVRSRCQRWAFLPPSLGVFKGWIDSLLSGSESGIESDSKSVESFFHLSAGSPLLAYRLLQSETDKKNDESGSAEHDVSKYELSLEARQQWVEKWRELHSRRAAVGHMVTLVMEHPADKALSFMASCVSDLLKLTMQVDDHALHNVDVISDLRGMVKEGVSPRYLLSCYGVLLKHWRLVVQGHPLNLELLWESVFLNWMKENMA